MKYPGMLLINQPVAVAFDGKEVLLIAPRENFVILTCDNEDMAVEWINDAFFEWTRKNQES